jgi:hypothetical protein
MLKNIVNEVDGSAHARKATKIAGDLGSPSQKVVANTRSPVLLVR